MKKISVLLILTACLLLLSGCWDKRELEDNTFAVLMGIDKAENKDIIVSIAFPLTQTEGVSGEDSGIGNYTVMSVKAPNIVEGLNMFGTKLAGPIALYSVKTIVISQEIAEDDMLSEIFSSWQYEEIRNTTNVVISECKASEFIEARVKKPIVAPLRQEELLLEQANGSAYYRPIQLLELLINLKSDSGDGVAMYGGIASESDGDSKDKKDKSDKSDKENEENKEDKKDNGEKGSTDIKVPVKENYLPNEIPVSSENKSLISGLAVFHGSKMQGILKSNEVQAYSMLTQNKANSNSKVILTLSDPLDADYDIVVEILSAGRNKINSRIKNDIPVFNIDVSLKCVIKCIQSGTDYTLSKNHKVLQEYIKNICTENMTNLITKIQKEYNADILNLGNKLAYHFKTIGDWEKYGWAEKYKESEIILNVNLDIRQQKL